MEKGTTHRGPCAMTSATKGNCNQLYLQREVIKANLCVSKGTR